MQCAPTVALEKFLGWKGVEPPASLFHFRSNVCGPFKTHRCFRAPCDNHVQVSAVSLFQRNRDHRKTALIQELLKHDIARLGYSRLI